MSTYPDEDNPPKCERHQNTYMFIEDCGWCGGDGVTEPGELHEEDPLWYDEDDVETCPRMPGGRLVLRMPALPRWQARIRAQSTRAKELSVSEYACWEEAREALRKVLGVEGPAQQIVLGNVILAAEERGRRRGVEEERKRCDEEKARERNATIEILTAPRCECGRFSMSGAYRNGLLMLGGTCGKDTLHAPDHCGDPPVTLAPRDSAPAQSDYPGCSDPAHDCRDGTCGMGPVPWDRK